MNITEIRDLGGVPGESFHHEWKCYGDHAYSISFDCATNAKRSCSVIFDVFTGEVYELDACDFDNDRAYRYIHPDYSNAYFLEARALDITDTAWDDVKYTELEVEEDILNKVKAMLSGEDYDQRVMLPLNLSRDELFKFMLMAHEQDITLNQLFLNAIELAIKTHLPK